MPCDACGCAAKSEIDIFQVRFERFVEQTHLVEQRPAEERRSKGSGTRCVARFGPGRDHRGRPLAATPGGSAPCRSRHRCRRASRDCRQTSVFPPQTRPAPAFGRRRAGGSPASGVRDVTSLFRIRAPNRSRTTSIPRLTARGEPSVSRKLQDLARRGCSATPPMRRCCRYPPPGSVQWTGFWCEAGVRSCREKIGAVPVRNDGGNRPHRTHDGLS